MEDFLKACIDRYVELSGRKGAQLRQVDTPFIDEQAVDLQHSEGLGELSPIAARVVMKVLYAARMARHDLLRPCQALARYLTKWSPAEDKKLHRLMCYIYSTLKIRMVSWCGDELKDVNLGLYTDADFASDVKASLSTSGASLKVEGPKTNFVIGAMSKKQTAVSHSSTESEIVAADMAIRTQGIPALIAFDVIADRPVNLNFYEDNQSTIKIIESGYSQQMRHISRTHRVDLAWLKERFEKDTITMRYIETQRQLSLIHISEPTRPY